MGGSLGFRLIVLGVVESLTFPPSHLGMAKVGFVSSLGLLSVPDSAFLVDTPVCEFSAKTDF